MNYKKISLFVVIVTAIFLYVGFYIDSKYTNLFVHLFAFFLGVYLIIGSIYDKNNIMEQNKGLTRQDLWDIAKIISKKQMEYPFIEEETKSEVR